MKEIIRIPILGFGIAGLMACCMSSNTKEPTTSPTPEEISWVGFCKFKGYDVHTQDDEIKNEFLDTWVGSAEEERMFNHLPAQEE